MTSYCFTLLDLVARCRQSLPMVYVIEVARMWYERVWQWAKEHVTITVPGVTLIFAATYILMLAVDAGSVGASWIQAIGSIVGILGAAAFPYMHEATKQSQARERLKEILLLLALSQRQELNRLRQVLYEAVNDFGEKSITCYLEQGWDLKWAPHIEALSAIPIADLDAKQVDMLGNMKVAAAYAAGVVARLNNWDFTGQREMADIVRLDDYYFVCNETVGVLSSPLS